MLDATKNAASAPRPRPSTGARLNTIGQRVSWSAAPTINRRRQNTREVDASARPCGRFAATGETAKKRAQACDPSWQRVRTDPVRPWIEGKGMRRAAAVAPAGVDRNRAPSLSPKTRRDAHGAPAALVGIAGRCRGGKATRFFAVAAKDPGAGGR